MYEIINDPQVGVSFAILIIARLCLWNRLEMSATLFRATSAPSPVKLEIEGKRPVRTALRS